MEWTIEKTRARLVKVDWLKNNKDQDIVFACQIPKIGKGRKVRKRYGEHNQKELKYDQEIWTNQIQE